MRDALLSVRWRRRVLSQRRYGRQREFCGAARRRGVAGTRFEVAVWCGVGTAPRVP